MSAYNDIDEYGPQFGKVDDETKVTKLLNKIMDPVLDATKTIAFPQPYYSKNFENATSLFLTQIVSLKRTAQASRAVSFAGTDHGGRGRGGRSGRNSNRGQGSGRHKGYGRAPTYGYGR